MATIEKRLNSDGTTQYRVKFRLKGTSPQTESFTRLTDARRWAQSKEASIREGRHFGIQEAKRHTVSDLINRYIGEVIPYKSSDKKNQIRLLEWWNINIGHLTLDQVTPAVLSEHRDKLLKTAIVSKSKKVKLNNTERYRSPSTVVRYLAAISHAFSVACKEWQWVESNPILRIRKPKEPRGRDRFLSDEERANLLTHCKLSSCKVLYTIVVLAISTGMRRGELMNLTWKMIDFKQECIRLDKTKNGERRTIPLTGYALVQLLELGKVRRLDSQLIFPGISGLNSISIDRPWRSAILSAGIENFHFHDLRHSSASYLAMNGASLIEIAAVLGHKTLTMVKRYSHISKSHTQQVVSSMNDKIFGSVNK